MLQGVVWLKKPNHGGFDGRGKKLRQPGGKTVFPRVLKRKYYLPVIIIFLSTYCVSLLILTKYNPLGK
jgi:hypothetical protein